MLSSYKFAAGFRQRQGIQPGLLGPAIGVLPSV